MNDIDFDELTIEDDSSQANDSQDIPRDKRVLNTTFVDKAVKDVVQDIRDKEIHLNPSYQRQAVWDKRKCSQLLESIWMSIPIPQIFLAEKDDLSLEVIDGQQRLTALIDYYNDEYKLRGLEVIQELNDKKYSNLPEKAKRILNSALLRLNIIKNTSHPDIKFDVFMRINQGSVQLNNQELRNCLYRGQFNNQLGDLVLSNSNFKQIMRSDKPHKRFKDIELILRCISLLRERYKNYAPAMKFHLNNFMEQAQKFSNQEIENEFYLFEETLEKVFTVFEKNAFRRCSAEGTFETTINAAVMDAQMCALESFSLDQVRDYKSNFKQAFISQFTIGAEDEIQSKKDEFIINVTQSTSSKKSLLSRIEYLKSCFDSCIESKDL